jgi:hypothetical protein
LAKAKVEDSSAGDALEKVTRRRCARVSQESRQFAITARAQATLPRIAHLREVVHIKAKVRVEEKDHMARDLVKERGHMSKDMGKERGTESLEERRAKARARARECMTWIGARRVENGECTVHRAKGMER